MAIKGIVLINIKNVKVSINERKIAIFTQFTSASQRIKIKV